MTDEQLKEYLARYDSAIPSAGPWLADRIINAAEGRKPELDAMAWLRELLAVVLPQPAFALATVLTLGIVIGLSLPTGSTTGTVNPVYFDERAL